jgi:hypothetical protein
LRDTSIPDFLKWYPDGQAGVYEKTNYRFILKFDDVECEVLFRGLDDAQDVRRLLSLQASFAVMDEFREISKDIFEAVQGRLGRYPDGMMVPHRPEWGVDEKGNPIQGCVTDEGKSNAHIWGATNPPDMDTFWEQFLSDPPKNAEVFFQPSGLSEQADWVHFLPSNYYENLAEGKSDEWVDVYIHAKFGKSLSGKPVFRAFNSDIHVSKSPLQYIKLSTNPLIIGHDFGLTPACTVSQVDPRGRLLTYAELTSDGMGELRFVREKLKPLLANRFPGMPVIVIGDPAGQQRAQTDERSVFDILKQEGFRVIPAKTNSIAARINAVDAWLTRMADGDPACLLDPSCKTLIQALRGGYRYKVKTNGAVDETPEKNHFSHLCFVAGTPVATPNGNIAIDQLKVGDEVITPQGKGVVSAAFMTHAFAQVTEYTFSNGSVLVATPDHPVFTKNRGKVPLDELQYTDILEVLQENVCSELNTQSKSSMELSTTASEKATTKLVSSRTEAPAIYIEMFGSTTTALSQKDTTSTTKTVTKLTTALRTWSAYVSTSTAVSTCMSVIAPILAFGNSLWKKLGLQRLSGMVAQKVNCSISALESWRRVCKSLNNANARIVAKSLQGSRTKINEGFVLQRANLHHGEQAALTTRPDNAISVAGSSRLTNIEKQKLAVRLVGKSPCLLPRPVYNITVESEHCYYAAGILVSNCDGFQYACLHADHNATGQLWTPKAKEVQKVKYVWA